MIAKKKVDTSDQKRRRENGEEQRVPHDERHEADGARHRLPVAQEKRRPAVERVAGGREVLQVDAREEQGHRAAQKVRSELAGDAETAVLSP